MHLQPEAVAQALGDLGAGPVGAVEGRAEVLVELGAVGEDAGADGVEDLDRQPAGLASVLSISGGIAPSSTALATRLVPWRPM